MLSTRYTGQKGKFRKPTPGIRHTGDSDAYTDDVMRFRVTTIRPNRNHAARRYDRGFFSAFKAPNMISSSQDSIMPMCSVATSKMSRASLDFLWDLDGGAGAVVSLRGGFVVEYFCGLPVLWRVLRLRPSRSAILDPLIRVFLLVLSAHEPSIDPTSKEGITNSGSGDRLFPLVDFRGGVNLRGR